MTSVKLVVPGRDFRYSAKHPLEMAEVLATNGYHVEVVCPMGRDVASIYTDRGYHITRLRPLVSRLLPSVRSLERAFLALLSGLETVDIVLGVDPPGFLVAHMLWMLRRANRLVYYAMELSLPEEVPQQETVRYQEKYVRDADLVLATGDHRADAMQNRFGLSMRPLVVHNSFVTSDDLESPSLHETLAARGIGAPGELVVFIGRLFQGHALAEVIESMVNWHPGAGLVLAGYGQAEYVQGLLDLAARLGVGERVYFVGEVRPGVANVLGLLRGASIGLVLKKYRGRSLNDVFYTPSKLFEYGAAGLPVILSDQVSLRFVEAEGWGVCVNPESPSEISSAVNRILADTAMRSRMSHTARSLFRTKYCMERQTEPVLAAMQRWRTGE